MQDVTESRGPLHGVRVLELGGIGPVPFAGMVLADMGAEVVRVHRPEVVEEGVDPARSPVLDRGRRSLGLDLKHPDGAACALRLVELADVVLEGFRPGVTERLGLGPAPCLDRNPRLVYGRMTGWGQEGPLAGAPGHDINFISVAGVLGHIGRRDHAPTPPLNLVADFGGGGMLLALGVASALFEAQRSGAGQVVDAAMVDGAALLMAMIWGHRSLGRWVPERGANIYDSGAPDYDVYATSDGGYLAIGAREPKFFDALLARLGIDRGDLPPQDDREGWPVVHDRIADVIRTRTRDEWASELEDAGICVSPVLSMDEVLTHPHNRARGTFVEREGLVQPAPAPRFSRTPSAIGAPMPAPGRDTDAVLADWGFGIDEIAALSSCGAVHQRHEETDDE
jgi:alpha-methylacyl-CoA racemase